MARGIIRHSPLTAAYLRKELHYNPETGEFRWLKLRNRRRADRAGYTDSRPYLIIEFERRTYKAHRLAFLLMTGHWPRHEVDHVDGDTLNNKWSNLRDVTHSENCRNRKQQWNNTSGQAGVHKHAQRNLWIVTFCSEYVGVFKSKEEAVAAAKAARSGWRPK
jgi:hypothetical protein